MEMPTALVAAALVAAAFAGPGAAMESASEAKAARAPVGLELRLDDLERRLDAIDERIECTRAAPRPFGGQTSRRNLLRGVGPLRRLTYRRSGDDRFAVASGWHYVLVRGSSKLAEWIDPARGANLNDF